MKKIGLKIFLKILGGIVCAIAGIIIIMLIVGLLTGQNFTEILNTIF